MSNYKHTITGIDWAQFKLWQREQIFAAVALDHDPEAFEYSGQYAIAWEDPDDLEAPVKITRPSPVWLAMAMHGGILPPVEVYWALAADEAEEDFTRHTRGNLLHDTPAMREMTELEAMQYLVMKDVPPRVWRDYKGNRTMLKIIPVSSVPTDRSNRNAWRIAELGEAA